MPSMTWRQLKEQLEQMPDERLDDNVTVYVSGTDEFYPTVEDYPMPEADGSQDQLDAGHRYLVI